MAEPNYDHEVYKTMCAILDTMDKILLELQRISAEKRRQAEGGR